MKKTNIINYILLGFIALIILAFVFSSKFRFFMLGAGVLVAVFYLGFKYGDKKIRNVLIISGIFLSISFLVYAGVSQSIIGEQIWRVDYGRLECVEDSVEISESLWVDQNRAYTCGQSYTVDECRIDLVCGDTSFLFPKCIGGYKINDGAWNRYSISGDNRATLTILKEGETIEFAQNNVFGQGGTLIAPQNKDLSEIQYIQNPYRLYTYEFGGKFLTNSDNCRLSDQRSLDRTNIKYGEWDELNKGENRNYFSSWILTSGLKTYNYQNKQVLCGGNSLYELKTERLADGSTRKIQSNFIKNVECCPHVDNNCDSQTFTFIKLDETEERECTFDFQCSNGGQPYIKLNSAVEESCVSGNCIERTLNVECVNDNDCISLYGTSYKCDLRSTNFGKCFKGEGQLQDEDEFTCNKWYQEEGVKTTYKYNILGLIKWGEVQEPVCKTADWVWIMAGSLIIIVLGSITLSLYYKGVKR